MRLIFFLACGAALLYSTAYAAYCVSKKMIKDAAGVGALAAVAAAAAALLAAVS